MTTTVRYYGMPETDIIIFGFAYTAMLCTKLKAMQLYGRLVRNPASFYVATNVTSLMQEAKVLI
jgi:hypothetical protein